MELEEAIRINAGDKVKIGRNDDWSIDFWRKQGVSIHDTLVVEETSRSRSDRGKSDNEIRGVIFLVRRPDGKTESIGYEWLKKVYSKDEDILIKKYGRMVLDAAKEEWDYMDKRLKRNGKVDRKERIVFREIKKAGFTEFLKEIATNPIMFMNEGDPFWEQVYEPTLRRLTKNGTIKQRGNGWSTNSKR